MTSAVKCFGCSTHNGRDIVNGPLKVALQHGKEKGQQKSCKRTYLNSFIAFKMHSVSSVNVLTFLSGVFLAEKMEGLKRGK